MKAIDRVEEAARKLLDVLDETTAKESPAARELRLALVSLDVERSYEAPAAGQKASSL